MYSNLRLNNVGRGDTVGNFPVNVSADFFGMCFMLGNNTSVVDQAEADNAGFLDVKWVRGCQQQGSRWSQIETSDGVFNFTQLEAAVLRAKTNGSKFSHGIYGTPRFYADNTTPRPTVTDFNATGPWGGLGEGAMPTDLVKLARYVTAVLNHFNSPTGAWRLANPTLGKGIDIIETGNEPPSVGNNNGSGFFWGTPPQNVDRVNAIINAVRAFDIANSQKTTIDLEGFSGNGAAIAFLNATGTTSGVLGKNLDFDRIATHPYSHMPIGYPLYTATGSTVYQEYIDNGINGIKSLRTQLAAIGVNKPIVISEVGYDGASNTNTLRWSTVETAAFREQWLKHWMIDMALMNVQGVAFWHWGVSPPASTQCLAGWWQQEPAAGNWFNDNVAGKTIIDARANGKTRWLKFSNGTELTV